MATTVKDKAQEEERKEVFIPRGHQLDDPNFFVSVNGPITLAPKGETSAFTEAEAYEIERSRRAEEAFAKKMQAMIDANNK